MIIHPITHCHFDIVAQIPGIVNITCQGLLVCKHEQRLNEKIKNLTDYFILPLHF